MTIGQPDAVATKIVGDIISLLRSTYKLNASPKIIKLCHVIGERTVIKHVRENRQSIKIDYWDNKRYRDFFLIYVIGRVIGKVRMVTMHPSVALLERVAWEVIGDGETKAECERMLLEVTGRSLTTPVCGSDGS